jgi:hypothetical protein
MPDDVSREDSPANRLARALDEAGDALVDLDDAAWDLLCREEQEHQGAFLEFRQAYPVPPDAWPTMVLGNRILARVSEQLRLKHEPPASEA